MIRKTFIYSLMVLLGIVMIPINVFAASGSMSLTCPATATPGSTVSCTVNFSSNDTAVFQFAVSASNGTATINGDSIIGGDYKTASATISVKVGSSGTTTVSVSGEGASTGAAEPGASFNLAGVSKSITIQAASTGGGSGSGGSNSGGNSNTNTQTETEKQTTQKTAEQIAEEELAERKRNPLITKVDIVDGVDAEKVYTTLETKTDVFEYSYEIPKNVASVKLNYTKLGDDVTITGPDTVTFADNEFEQSVTLTATQGEVSQEIKLTITRPVTASTTQDLSGVSLKIVDRDEVDTLLKDYGFGREVYKDSNDLDSFYYTNNAVRLQLYRTEDNQAYWLLLDENNAVIREVVAIFSEATHTVSFLWEAPEDTQSQTHQTVKYEPHSFEVSESLQAVDSTLTFNTTVGAWRVEDITIEPTNETQEPTAEVETDEESDSLTEVSNEPQVGFLAYGMDASGVEGFKYIDETNKVSMAAFASFDVVNSSANIVSYAIAGIALTSAVVFGLLWLKERRKLQQYLTKKQVD